MEPASGLLMALLYALVYILVVALVCYIVVRVLALFNINGTVAKIVYLIGAVIAIIILVRLLLGFVGP